MEYTAYYQEKFNGLFIKNIFYFDEIDSSNLYCKRNIEDLKTGDVIIASYQTNGRGQRGRIWHSHKNLGLYFSIILKSDLEIKDLKFLTLLSANSICKEMKKIGLPASIKEPNDVFIGDRKVSGILIENQKLSKSNSLIIGIGININHTKKDFPSLLQNTATSLRMELNKKVDCKNIFISLLKQIDFDIYSYFVNLNKIKQ